VEGRRTRLEELKTKGLKVSRALALKEMFSEVWGYSYEKVLPGSFSGSGSGGQHMSD